MPRARRLPVVVTATLSLLGAVVAPALGVSDEVARDFVRMYVNAVRRHDVDAINASMNAAELVARAQRAAAVAPGSLDGLAEGVRDGLDWGRSMATGIGENGHYTVLKIRPSGDGHRALLRFVNDQGGLNYHDLHLSSRADGGVEIVDVHVYLSGELLSDTIARSLREFVRAAEVGDEAYLGSVGMIEQMTNLLRGGRFEEALAAYDEMPPSMQRDKTVLIMRVSCASRVGDEALNESCRAFRAAYPNDPSIDLLTVEQLLARRRWADATAALERVQAVVGPDAYLDDLIANVHLQSGRLEMARRLARRSVEREPGLDEGHWTLLEIAVRQKDHPETARVLATLERDFGWVFDRLEEVERYGAFVRSPAYREWIRGRSVTMGE